MEMTVSFAGGKKVVAEFKGMKIVTDQPVSDGGEGSAPSPYDYFLASVGTCAGVYVLGFCESRGIPVADIELRQRMEFAVGADGKNSLAKIAIEIVLPPEFPEKYRGAVVKAAELCAVKKTIMHPPVFEVTSVVA
jgi:ribosomal protein S12 methylthiotransferase accessory factor